MLSYFSHVQFFSTPWTVAHQALLSIEFPRQECWSGWPFPSPGDLPNPGTEPRSLTSPALSGGFLPRAPPGKPILKETSQLLGGSLITSDLIPLQKSAPTLDMALLSLTSVLLPKPVSVKL